MREELLLRKERCGWPGREEWHRQSRVSLRDQGLIDRLAVCPTRILTGWRLGRTIALDPALEDRERGLNDEGSDPADPS
jgi:hypothetical protein